MNKKIDYHYFIPIFLWIGKEKEIYHFTDKVNNFWEEWDLSEKEKLKMEDTWKLYKSFYVLSPQYYGFFNRGTADVLMVRNMSFPYETRKILSTTKSNSYEIYLQFKIFMYPFPNTTLLYINVKPESLHKVILWDKETQKDDKLVKLYNFLPTKENKKIPWYEKHNPNETNFFYVYNFEPTYRFWEQNDENICLPSHNSKGYKTLAECVYNTRNSIKNRKVDELQNISLPLYIISSTSKHPIQLYQKNIPTILELLFILFFFIILLYKNK